LPSSPTRRSSDLRPSPLALVLRAPCAHPPPLARGARDPGLAGAPPPRPPARGRPGQAARASGGAARRRLGAHDLPSLRRAPSMDAGPARRRVGLAGAAFGAEPPHDLPVLPVGALGLAHDLSLR